MCAAGGGGGETKGEIDSVDCSGRVEAGQSTAGNIVMGRAGSHGFPPLQKSGSILRSQVGLQLDMCKS